MKKKKNNSQEMDGERGKPENALSSSSSDDDDDDDGIRFLATSNGNCEYGIPCARPVRSRAHAGSGPCRFDASPQA